MKFNAVNFNIWDIPGYFFCAGLSVVISVTTFIILVTKKDYPLQTNMRILALSSIFLLIGARLFGCLSGIYRDIGLGVPISWGGIKETGIVFYGGLLGLLVIYNILSKWSGQDKYIMDILAVIIPLFHVTARIGCFLGGCCFGIENHGMLSIEYTNFISNNITTVQRIPIQLIEALFNFCIFVYLLSLFCSTNWENKNILRQYLMIYSIGRFVIEFFRGDSVRGIICGVSFSQIISVFILIGLTFKAWRHKKQNRIIMEALS